MAPNLYNSSMNDKHILVVDDHQEIRDPLAKYLEQHGFQVSTADGGEQMRAQLQKADIDLIVLDLMMPGEDGLSLCRHVREIQGPPVIMLTAMSEDADCVVGLEMGADDYVTKPFVPRVLLARIKAVLRRHSPEGPEENQGSTNSHSSSLSSARELRFKGWTLDIHQRHLVREDGLLVPLSNAEFKLLQVFLAHPQQVLSRDQLLSHTQGREAQPFDRSIDNQISRLRKKVETDAHNPTLIKTVWGGGYMFTERVQP